MFDGNQENGARSNGGSATRAGKMTYIGRQFLLKMSASRANQLNGASLIGGIAESAMTLDTPARRIYFWNGVKLQLAGLKLPAKTRAAIMQAITKRVPPVTGRQRQQLARRLRANGLGAKARRARRRSLKRA